MNKSVKVGIGTLLGAGVGSVSSKFMNVAINKTLLKKISSLDDELDDMLSKRQLEIKSKLERRSKDLEILSETHPNYFQLKFEVSKLNKDLLNTLREDQMKVHNKINIANSDYLEKSKNTNMVFTMLGGFAGGLIVSNFSK